MSNFKDKYVKCPFYLRQDGTKIYCDGFEEGTYIHLSFKTTALMNFYKSRNCHSISGCKKCPIYTLAAKRYEKEGIQ